jgi:hypothetical protein
VLVDDPDLPALRRAVASRSSRLTLHVDERALALGLPAIMLIRKLRAGERRILATFRRASDALAWLEAGKREEHLS